MSPWLTIFAVILGPILAVQVERYLERKRENRNRKESVFKKLMATRGSVLSQRHVEALNQIDLEFSDDKKYRSVVEAWKEYHYNLEQLPNEEHQLSSWENRNDDLLASLLYEMSRSLGYNFDKVSIKNQSYVPVGHDEEAEENELIRKGVLEMINGNRAVPVELEINRDNEKKYRTS